MAVLVERLANTDFEDYITRNIATPLGISSWTWHLSRKPDAAAKLMQMSERNHEGALIPGKTPMWDEPEAERGGVGMYSTVDDFMRFLADFLADAPVTLRKETMELMFTPQFDEGSKLQQSIWDLSCLGLVGRSMEGVTKNHGLGGFVLPREVRREGYFNPEGTLGWHGMTNTQWSANRKEGVAYFFGAQVIPWGDEKTQELIKEFDTAVWKTYVK